MFDAFLWSFFSLQCEQLEKSGFLHQAGESREELAQALVRAEEWRTAVLQITSQYRSPPHLLFACWYFNL